MDRTLPAREARDILATATTAPVAVAGAPAAFAAVVALYNMSIS